MIHVKRAGLVAAVTLVVPLIPAAVPHPTPVQLGGLILGLTGVTTAALVATDYQL